MLLTVSTFFANSSKIVCRFSKAKFCNVACVLKIEICYYKHKILINVSFLQLFQFRVDNNTDDATTKGMSAYGI